MTADMAPTPLSPTTGRVQRFRALLDAPGLVLAPGVFDCLTARLVEQSGFPAAYISGSGVSFSVLGAPDVGLVSPTELFERARRIADMVDLPVIADADTGYGGPLNVVRTIRELERAGVAAVQLEDQAWPKKCGHEPGRRLVPAAVMADRIAAAVDARENLDIAIIARTDARTSKGVEAAIERGNIYREAGADVIFVESPESREEMARINAEIPAPTLANMVEGGRTPMLGADDLAALGYRIAIYPNSLTRLFARAGLNLLASLREQGGTGRFRDGMLSHRELWDLFDYDRWTALETRLSANERRSQEPRQ